MPYDPFKNGDYDRWRTKAPSDDEIDTDENPCSCGALKPEGNKRCDGCEKEQLECAEEDYYDGLRDEK